MPPQGGGADGGAMANLFLAFAAQVQQMQQQMEEAQAAQGAGSGAALEVRGLTFHPPGTERPLLDDVSFLLAPNQMGLIIGRSGSGKTTLLQLLAGLSEPTGGDISIVLGSAGTVDLAADGSIARAPAADMQERMNQVGLVFQFPERHFLGDDLLTELTFTWPRALNHLGTRAALAARLDAVLRGVGLHSVPLHVPPAALSGGQQRRLALAIQLVRRPALLLLDEPLAGLDWRARAEVVGLLRQLKEQCTLLVVSHDLRELSPLVDVAWRMEGGGRLAPVDWPPGSFSELEE